MKLLFHNTTVLSLLTYFFLKFITETRDPCTGQAKSNKQAEFGLTTTSGMADVLCAFCQHIKNLRCIWQFCSHPDGVYKIKVSENKG